MTSWGLARTVTKNFRIICTTSGIYLVLTAETTARLGGFSPEELWGLVIEKWELVVQMCQDYPDYPHSCGGELSCVFCLVYTDEESKTYCGVCPIALAGYPSCGNITFKTWSKHRDEAAAENQLNWLRRLRDRVLPQKSEETR